MTITSSTSSPAPAVPSTAPSLDILTLLRRTAELDAVRSAVKAFDPAATERDWKHLGQIATAGADQVDLWLISWPVGGHTGWHDHGTACGGFTVLRGTLTERTWRSGIQTRAFATGEGRDFGSHHIHDVVNRGTDLAVSLHGYNPRLSMMTRYSVHSEGIQIVGVEKAGAW